MSIHQACNFYNVSKTALQSCLKNSSTKQTRDKPPNKIPNKAFSKDVEKHPDNYLYEKARRFNCSNTSIHTALKCLGIIQKKELRAPKSLSDQRSEVPE